jgi:hypothetical protein
MDGGGAEAGVCSEVQREQKIRKRKQQGEVLVLAGKTLKEKEVDNIYHTPSASVCNVMTYKNSVSATPPKQCRGVSLLSL